MRDRLGVGANKITSTNDKGGRQAQVDDGGSEGVVWAIGGSKEAPEGDDVLVQLPTALFHCGMGTVLTLPQSIEKQICHDECGRENSGV